MNKIIATLVFIMLISGGALYAQAPSAHDPGAEVAKKEKARQKKLPKGKPASTYEEMQKAYAERMKLAAKKYKKEARLMKKPQYSDPLYFGHKRKPKKRPKGKRKLCKECGIVH